jgi:hypothetical protein
MVGDGAIDVYSSYGPATGAGTGLAHGTACTALIGSGTRCLDTFRGASSATVSLGARRGPGARRPCLGTCGMFRNPPVESALNLLVE